MSQKTEQFKKGLAIAESIAAEWDKVGEQTWQQGPRAEIFEFFCRYVGAAPQRVLDVGCGPGASTLRLMQHGYDAIGVDFSPKMIEAAEGRGVEAIVSDCDPLPFADATFDAVLCCSCLEWTTEPVKMIQEIKRVVKPGGRVVFAILGACVQARWEAYDRLHGKPVAQNMMMPWELHRLLGEMGFEVQEMLGTYAKTTPQEVVAQLPTWQLQSSVAFLWAFGAQIG